MCAGCQLDSCIGEGWVLHAEGCELECWISAAAAGCVQDVKWTTRCVLQLRNVVKVQHNCNDMYAGCEMFESS